MSKILKKWFDSSFNSLLSLVFTKEAKAQVDMPVILYGPPPAPGEILLNWLPSIGIASLVFVVAPIVGLIWYRKRGGKKKWPVVVVWILALLFILALAAFITLLYSSM